MDIKIFCFFLSGGHFLQAHLRFTSGTNDMRTVNITTFTTSNTIVATIVTIFTMITHVLLKCKITSFKIDHSRISREKYTILSHISVFPNLYG